MNVIAVVGLVLTCLIGLWKFFIEARDKRWKEIDEAQKMYREAVESGDTSAITVALARLDRLRYR